MSVLQRKAQVGNHEHQARSMTVPKALRVALAKVADKSFDMALAVIGVVQERWSGDEIEGKMEADKLLMLLDGPLSATGGAVLDSALVSALVQQQTTGRVGAIPATGRKMTATDAALCAPLLDGLFQRAHEFLETPEDRNVLPAYKFGARAENPRLFGMAMGQAKYHVLRLTIDIAAGTAQSTVCLILPVPEPKPAPFPDESGAEPVEQSATLERSVMGLKAELSAVLCRVRLSLSEISNLKPGDCLQVPSEAFDAVELLSIQGQRIGRGTMGPVAGHRALSLNGAASTRSSDNDSMMTDEDEDEESCDYSNLNLPDLDIPPSPSMLQPDADGGFEDLSNLPDLPDLGDFDSDLSGGFPDLPDLPDLPDEVDHGDDLPNLDDVPKLNIA